MSIFRTKELSEIRKELRNTKLKKNLGATDLVLLGLGGIIGTGIFVLTGLAAAKYSGPAITLSFLIGAIACVFTALSYAELAAMLPVAGGSYTFAYATLGEGFAALVGWLAIMVATFGSATVAAGWSGYVTGILEAAGLHILPPELTKIPSEGGWVNFPAVFIISLLTFIIYRGTKDAAKLNGILVFVKLSTIVFFLLAAFPHIDAKNWEVFAPNGFLGVIAGAGFVFMAYTGFDTLATAAEECKNPNRDLPIGIIGSLIGSAILYVIVSGLLTAIVPYASLDNAEPMAYALRVNGVNIGAKLVATGAITGMSTVVLSLIFGQSRILFVMARDGMMPPFFGKIHERYSTPSYGVLVTGTIMALIAGFAPVSTLGQLSSMSTLLVFSMVSICVMVLRYKKPNEKRPFRCPAVYLTASLSTLMCLLLLSQLFIENWKPYLLSCLVGLVIYASYGYRNSHLNTSKR